MKFKLITTTAAALALAACGGAEEETEVAAVEQPIATTEPQPAAMAADTSTPQGFVNAAAASDMFELESSRLAEEKSQTPAVREFAQMMIADHTNSTQKLEQAAGQVEGVTVTPELMPAQQQQLTELRTASAEQFDSLYKQHQVAAHEQALNLMRTQAESGTEQALKSFASETAPIIERHLGTARELP